VFTKPFKVEKNGKTVSVLVFLEQPELVFRHIWLTPKYPDVPEAEHFNLYWIEYGKRAKRLVL
jgi:hypothetical protein